MLEHHMLNCLIENSFSLLKQVKIIKKLVDQLHNLTSEKKSAEIVGKAAAKPHREGYAFRYNSIQLRLLLEYRTVWRASYKGYKSVEDHFLKF